jgi:low affinity Fe/Cu permease
MNRFSHWFGLFAKWAAHAAGHPATFALAAGVIVAWAIAGPFYDFSETWQLVVNTATTIVTFLMVFLIQNTQNRDTGAIQAKLDELIRATEGAHNALLDLEELDAKQIEHIRKNYRDLASAARQEIEMGLSDTDRREVVERSGKKRRN